VGVISDRKLVVGPQPVVTFSVVEIDTSAFVGVVRVLVGATLIVGQMVCRLKLAEDIGIAEA
jgi:hypothetical protein